MTTAGLKKIAEAQSILTDELAANRLDAERYRWLRHWANGKRLEIFQSAATRTEFDEMIDAAMAANVD